MVRIKKYAVVSVCPTRFSKVVVADAAHDEGFGGQRVKVEESVLESSPLQVSREARGRRRFQVAPVLTVAKVRLRVIPALGAEEAQAAHARQTLRGSFAQ